MKILKLFVTNDLIPKINVQSLQHANATSEMKHNLLTDSSELTNIEIEEVPELKEVVLRDLPKSEPDWILIYACYKTSFGKEAFSEQDIKDQYDETDRTNNSRLSNLSKNIKSLLNKKFIKVQNSTHYLVKTEGLEYAKIPKAQDEWRRYYRYFGKEKEAVAKPTNTRYISVANFSQCPSQSPESTAATSTNSSHDRVYPRK